MVRLARQEPADVRVAAREPPRGRDADRARAGPAAVVGHAQRHVARRRAAHQQLDRRDDRQREVAALLGVDQHARHAEAVVGGAAVQQRARGHHGALPRRRGPAARAGVPDDRQRPGPCRRSELRAPSSPLNAAKAHCGPRSTSEDPLTTSVSGSPGTTVRLSPRPMTCWPGANTDPRMSKRRVSSPPPVASSRARNASESPATTVVPATQNCPARVTSAAGVTVVAAGDGDLRVEAADRVHHGARRRLDQQHRPGGTPDDVHGLVGGARRRGR